MPEKNNAVRRKISAALPHVSHLITYLLFIISSILLLVGFMGSDWLYGFVELSSPGTDWSVGYWEYCHRKHVTDDGGNLYQESKRCYSMDILPYRGQFVIHIGENDHIGLLNNVTHEMALPGSCLQVARIWVITAFTLNLLGGIFVWLDFIKENVRWMYAAYIWFVSTVLQVLADMIFISVFFRLRQIDLPMLVNSDRFPKFKFGVHYIVSLSSTCIMFTCVVFALLISEFDIPRPYSPKRVFLKKVGKLKKMQKQKEEDERKVAERKQKEMNKKKKDIARQKAALTKRTSALQKKNSMYGSSKGKSRKSNVSRIRTSKHQSVLGKKASARKSRIMHLKRLELQARNKSFHEKQQHNARLTTLEGWEDEVFDETWHDAPEKDAVSKPVGNTVPSFFSAPEEFHKVLDRTHSQDTTQVESKSDDEGVKEEDTKTEVKKRGNTVRFANI